MEKKKIYYTDKCPGYCYVPVSSEEDKHEFGLYDAEGTKIDEGFFTNMEIAIKKAVEVYGSDMIFTVKDLTEEEYLTLALKHRNYIKKCHPSFKKSNIILDMTRLYLRHCSVEWYTYLPFTYNGVEWCYRETASSEWVERVGA